MSFGEVKLCRQHRGDYSGFGPPTGPALFLGELMGTAIAAAIEHLIEKRGQIDTAISALQSLDSTATEASSAPRATAPKRGPARMPFPNPKPAGETAARQMPSPVQDAILALLKKAPMSSNEVFNEMRKAGYKGEISGVYSALQTMKTKGVVIGKTDDEGDGTRRWFLKAE